MCTEGEINVHRIVAATDPGHTANPQQIEALIEGSFAHGFLAALYGACKMKNGRIEQANSYNYPVSNWLKCPAWNPSSCRRADT